LLSRERPIEIGRLAARGEDLAGWLRLLPLKGLRVRSFFRRADLRGALFATLLLVLLRLEAGARAVPTFFPEEVEVRAGLVVFFVFRVGFGAMLINTSYLLVLCQR
jgi:hypothetical protein